MPPINPLIALGVKGLDTATPINNLLALQDQQRGRELQEKQIGLAERQVTQGDRRLDMAQQEFDLNKLNAEDKRRFTNNVRDSLELRHILNTQGEDAALAWAGQNIARNVEQGLDSAETKQAIKMIQDGKVDQLKSTLDFNVQAGERFGIIAPGAEIKAPDIKEIKQGDRIITAQFNRTTGRYEPIAEAPRFEPQKPDTMSPERLAQEQSLRTIDLNNAITQAVAIAQAKTEIDENSPTGQLKRQEIEQKIAKEKINEAKAEMRTQAQAAKVAIVTGKIDEAKSLVNSWFTTGFMGAILDGIGGTDARNLRGTLDTIKANLGFGELQAMRESSPTGGALGAVAVRELDLLQSTLASLDQGQDDDVLLKNLQQIETHLTNWQSAVNGASEADYAGEPVQVNTTEEYNAVPKGARYRDAAGNIAIKR